MSDEPNTVTNTAPERIWLQHSDSMLDVDLPFPEDHEGISWCHEQVFPGDVEYARSDLCAMLKQQRDALLAALNPRKWTKEMNEAWHRSIPDVILAFEKLREAAIAAAEGSE